MEASALSAPAGLGRRSVAVPLLRLRSDEQLVVMFRAGNDDAFRVIHDRYRVRLLAYTRQMLSGSQSDAEDALQDVFLRAYRALRADARPVSLRAWLYRVAHNRCVDQIRRPVPEPADVLDTSRPPTADPWTQTRRREDLARLVADLQRLPEQQRSALLMREMDGLSYAELADALDTSVPAVKSLLVRARVSLAEAVEARDADCADIREDLAGSCERGVRASGRARRHLRECACCTGYRQRLQESRRGVAALAPVGSPFVLAKLLGLGGAGTGAAGAAAGGGAGIAGAGKVAAIVCCAAAVGGGAAEVRHLTAAPVAPAVAATAPSRAAAAPVAPRPWTAVAPAAPAAADPVLTPVVPPAPTVAGAVLAPDESAASAVPADAVVDPILLPLPPAASIDAPEAAAVPVADEAPPPIVAVAHEAAATADTPAPAIASDRPATIPGDGAAVSPTAVDTPADEPHADGSGGTAWAPPAAAAGPTAGPTG